MHKAPNALYKEKYVNKQAILLLYDYNYWANRRILGMCAQVPREQFVATGAHGHSDLRGTLLHTLDTEYGWRMLCQHGQGTPVLEAADFPTPHALEQRWHAEEQAMRAYLSKLDDADLAGVIRYTADSGEPRERVLWHCLLHVLNHGTQHRSEAAVRLTELGYSPGDLDFTVFLNEQLR